MGKVLGSFSKAVDGSLALNFGQSGGHNCDPECTFHPDNPRAESEGKCYALSMERQRPSVRNSLGKREAMHPVLVINMAIDAVMKLLLAGIVIPWFRFSVSGSLPRLTWESLKTDKAFCDALRRLVLLLVENDIPVHLPKEGESAEVYRFLLGDLITVRRSFSQEIEQWHEYTAGASSVVVGDYGDTRKERIAKARAAAREHEQRTGRRTVVCPAVLSNINNHIRRQEGRPQVSKAQCGTCTACAVDTFDIVYPKH